MDRRLFLQAGIAASAMAQQPTAPVPQPPPPKKAKITSSVMLWTLKGSFEEKLQIAARAGVQSVELVSEHVQWTDAQIAAMKKLARSFELGMDTIIATPDWKSRKVSSTRATASSQATVRCEVAAGA